MNSGIYTILNIVNKKIYVGQSVNISNRLRGHRNFLRRNKHQNLYLQNEYNKYGEESFEFDVLEYCDKQFLFSLELFWANILNSTNREYGYNVRPLSHTGKPSVSEETRRKSSISHMGHKMSKETRDKIAASHLGKPKLWLRGRKSPNKGRKMSDETRQRLKIANTNNPLIMGKRGPRSLEVRVKISNANKGKKRTPEMIRAMSETAKRLHRERMLKKS